MARTSRRDAPGALHHVTNRGIARRTCFETRADMRKFLAALARLVRDGQLEVLAFALLTTHFHLLLRSTIGALSDSMRRLENTYVRYFNRSRRRDGSLFRGRFWSRPVDSYAYLKVLIRYIDHNATVARLAETPADYPWCSATYFSGTTSPRWLSRDVLEGVVESHFDAEFTSTRYKQLFGVAPNSAEIGLVETRSRSPAVITADVDSLVDAAPAAVRDWMLRKAQLADGTRPGAALLAPATVVRVVEALRSESPGWQVRPAHKWLSGWDVLLCGLLRGPCGCTQGAVAAHAGTSVSTGRHRAQAHLTLVRDDHEYGAIAAAALSRALRATYS